MNPVAHDVPRDAVDVAKYVENFRSRFGMVPIGGGEAVPGVAPAITQPPAAAPAPAPAAAPAAAPPAAPPPPAAAQGPAPWIPPEDRQPQAQPAAAPPAQPQPPQAPPAEQPAWMNDLFARMDRLGPAEQVDPLMGELGLAPVMPGQPQPQQPQVPASPGLGQPQPQPQPGTPFPNVNDPAQAAQAQLVEDWVNNLVQQRIEQSVNPELEQFRQERRTEELAGLRSDYEEFRDPVKGNPIVLGARQWASQLRNPKLAEEPLFLELALHARRSIALEQQQRLQQAQPGVPAVPGAPAPAPYPGQPQPQQPYPIEQPGVAAPAAAVDPAQQVSQRIVAAGGGNGLAGSVFI